MKGLNSARAHLECSFTAWFRRLKCIKSDRKIQDKGAENVFIYVSYDSNHTKNAVFFSNISMITNVILILYNISINNKLILRYLRFRHHIACFCCISPTKNNSKQPQCCFESQWFVHEWINEPFKWFGLISHLKSIFIFLIILNISIQCFMFKT